MLGDRADLFSRAFGGRAVEKRRRQPPQGDP
jgi:hypothetical protein